MRIGHWIITLIVILFVGWKWEFFLPPDEEKSQSEIRLVFLGADAMRQPLEAKIASFNQGNPNGRIKLEIYPTGSEQKLNLMLATGQAPDIWATGLEKLPTLLANKSISSISNLIFDADLAGLLPVSETLAGKIQGELFAVPFLYNPIGLFINKTMLQECGIATENSRMDRTQFEEALQRIRQKKGANVFGCLVSYYFSNLLPWLWGSGADPFPAGEKFSNLDSPEVVRILTWLNTLIVQDGLLPNPEDVDRFGMPDYMLFKKERAAMFVGRASLSAQLKDADFEWEIIPVPGDQDIRTTNILTTVLVCRKQHEKDRLLGQSLKFLISPQFQDFFANFGVVVPAERNVIVDKYLIPGGYPPLEKRQYLLNLVEDGRLFVPPVHWDEIVDLVINPNLWKLYKSNPQEIEQICKNMAAHADAILRGENVGK